ncbi:MAG: L,D-transpeptidase [Nitrospirae bacterium]|nr:MAG: L,D-transpeptidase [Nitrospirota bacterium]
MAKWNIDKSLVWTACLFLTLLIPINAYSFKGAYSVDARRKAWVVGFLKYHRIASDKETLVELALKEDLGYNEIADANPGVDPWYPGKGTRVVVPTFWVTPEVEDLRDSLIVVNLAELRLYFFKRISDKRVAVITFPIGIGSEGRDTPTGRYRIVQKMKDPVWVVPESIRAEDPSLPERVPPGPDNPLGRYALRLSNPSYLIHGTNKPLGVGRRVSHGCLRMYPEDIETLYNLVTVGTEVRIVYEPIKISVEQEGIFIEVHRDYRANEKGYKRAIEKLLRMGLLRRVSTLNLYSILEREDGIPHFLRFEER